MAEITQTISTIPEAGHRGVDSRDDFVNKQEAYQDHQRDTLQPELNNFKNQANALRSEVNTTANQVANDKTTVVNAKNEAVSSANTATSAKTYIENYVIPTEATYSKETIDTKVGASLPYSGYTSVSKKLDNFVFQESSSFLNKVADKNRYVKFGDKVVDTYGEELVTNGDFSDGTTGWYVVGGSFSVVNNVGRFSGILAQRYQTIIRNVPNGTTYQITLSANVEEGGTFNLYAWATDGGNEPIGVINSSGKHTFQYTINDTDDILYLNLYHTNSGVFYVDNISVREIQTAQFQVPEVSEIITDGSNTTSVSVNSGDYVVDGSELLPDGTFDSLGDWVLDTSWSISNGELIGNGTTRAYIPTGLSLGETYSISYEIKTLNSGSVRIDAGTGSLGTVRTSVGVYTESMVFTGNLNLYINQASRAFDGTIGNISVKRVSDTFRATRDTADMHDYEDNSLSLILSANSGKVVKCTGINANGVNGNFYKWVHGSSLTVNLSTTALNNPTYWQDLGTASNMSLENPYFEDRTEIGVTNQQLAYHAYNTLTNSYEGILTETLFSDVSKEDLLDNPTWLARNGFSKVSEFLYSKGAYLVLPVGIWQSLNKGAYHPVFNGFGCAYSTNGIELGNRTYWFMASAVNNSVADTISNACTGVTGTGSVIGTTSSSYGYPRPDSKAYDITYPDQFIDVREYSKILTPYEVELIRDDKIENGVEESVSFTYYKFNALPLLSGGATYLVNRQIKNLSNEVIDLGSISNYENSINLVFSNGSGLYKLERWTANEFHYEIKKSVSDVWTSGDYTADFTINDTLIFDDKLAINKLNMTKPILSSNTKLSTDLIGNPTNYPQIMLDRLASGVGIVGVNPLLVGQDGTNYIPDGLANDYILANKSTGNLLTHLRSSDSGITYVAGGTVVNIVTNVRDLNATENAVGNIAIFSYTSKNNPLIQTTPMPVIDVEPKVIATNSHSLYKGALIGNQVSGKIQVGNGTNGYESRVLENVENKKILYASDGILPYGSSIEVIYFDDGTINTKKFYEYTDSTVSSTFNFTNFDFTSAGWKEASLLTTPQHPTISLDNSNSSASKYFNTLEEGDNGVLAGVYGEEITYDGVSEWGDTDFSQLTNGTIPDVNGGSGIKTFHGVIPLNARIK